jgi:uncharacterized protein YfkK (UPF0435 family)
MTVHKAITKHSQSQANTIKTFKEMDLRREQAIENVLKLAKQKQPFSVDEINNITKEMNLFRKQANVGLPERKHVTLEMVNDYLVTKY